jgi:hypothetical protein
MTGFRPTQAAFSLTATATCAYAFRLYFHEPASRLRSNFRGLRRVGSHRHGPDRLSLASAVGCAGPRSS